MASIEVTAAITDPSASLVDGTTYLVQNKATNDWLRVYEGAAFDAATNANDGVLLAPLHHPGAAPNSLRLTYDAALAVRLNFIGRDGFAKGFVEFVEAG